MLEDFRRIWRPRLMLKAYTYDKTDVRATLGGMVEYCCVYFFRLMDYK
jgi:hypothetical protein